MADAVRGDEAAEERLSEDDLIARYFRPLAGEGAFGLRDDAARITPAEGDGARVKRRYPGGRDAHRARRSGGAVQYRGRKMRSASTSPTPRRQGREPPRLPALGAPRKTARRAWHRPLRRRPAGRAEAFGRPLLGATGEDAGSPDASPSAAFGETSRRGPWCTDPRRTGGCGSWSRGTIGRRGAGAAPAGSRPGRWTNGLGSRRASFP